MTASGNRHPEMSDKQFIEILHQLGLTPIAAECYWELVNNLPRSLRAKQLHETLNTSQTSLFRALRELRAKGFITSHNIVGFRHYKAEPLSFALDNYALYQRQLAQALIKQLNLG